MSPRPRKATDDEILSAAERVMLRLSPSRLTLADIAAEAGLTAGALVQRFGSKRELLRAVVARFAAATRPLFERIRAEHPSPLGAIYAFADLRAAMAASPATLAHHLGWLQLDLTDDEILTRLQRQSGELRAILRELLDEAVAAGELHLTDTARLARLVEVTIAGSVLVWPFHQEGPAREAMWRDLDALFVPYR